MRLRVRLAVGYRPGEVKTMTKEAFEDRRFAAKTAKVIEQANMIMDEYEDKMTLRQLHYQFVARDLYENTQQNYKKLGDILRNARMAGRIDWEELEDRGRRLAGWGGGYSSPSAAVRSWSHGYSEDMWTTQSVMVEVWTEKDALSSIISDPAYEHSINYFASKGYPSITALKKAADRFKRYGARDKDVVVLFLSDHDPEGIDMLRNLRETMDIMGVTNLSVRRIGLTMEQIRELNPPSSIAKESSSRLAMYESETGTREAWELDALPAQYLKDLIDVEITRYINQPALAERKREEEDNRQLLIKIAENFDEIVEWLDENEDDDEDDWE